MDLMVPLDKRSRWQDNELRYLLRSYHKYCYEYGNSGTVWVVGHKPSWVVNVEHLPHRDSNKKKKDHNIMDKVLLACKAGVSGKFIRASDDQCFLTSNLCTFYSTPNPNWGTSNPGWYRRLQTTLAALGHNRCYDIHVPQVYDRDITLEILSKGGYSDYLVNTWILGQYPNPGIIYPGGLFLTHTDLIKDRLIKMFPEPSPYEQRIVVALLTCDRYEYTKQTVDTLLQHNPGLILYHADDASTDSRVCDYVQSKGFRTLIQNTKRLGCSPTTDKLMQAIPESEDTIVIYLQNDFKCLRPIPISDIASILKGSPFLQLSYRIPRSRYHRETTWRYTNGELWSFGDRDHSVIYSGYKKGLGYHPSAAYLGTWQKTMQHVKSEKQFTRKTEYKNKQISRLTEPVFQDSGRESTPDGQFGRKRVHRLKSATKIIVSMATITARLDTTHKAVNSILNGIKKPDKFILVVPEGAVIPKELSKLPIEILHTKEIGAAKKLIPVLQRYMNDNVLIITADDDIEYPNRWLWKLDRATRRTPKCVVCCCARRMDLSKSYGEWEKLYNRQVPEAHDLLPVGYCGIAYRPHFFTERVFNIPEMKTLVPWNDDLWFAVCREPHVPVRVVNVRGKFRTIKTGGESLYLTNIHRGENDRAIKRLWVKH